jgi:hypothetical protein
LGAVIFKEGTSVLNCAEIQDYETVKRTRTMHSHTMLTDAPSDYTIESETDVDKQLHRIYQSVSINKYDALSDPAAKEYLDSVQVDLDQARAKRKLDNPPPLMLRQLKVEEPVGYQNKAKGQGWNGGPPKDCTTVRANLGGRDEKARIDALMSTGPWQRLGSQYDPMRSLIDDLNAQDAQILYAKTGLVCADRAISNIDMFLAYLRRA